MGEIRHIVLHKHSVSHLSADIKHCNKYEGERYGAVLYTCKRRQKNVCEYHSAGAEQCCTREEYKMHDSCHQCGGDGYDEQIL